MATQELKNLTPEEAVQLKKLLKWRIKFLTMITEPAPRYSRAGSIVVETEPSEATKEWQEIIDRNKTKLDHYTSILSKIEG